MDIESENDLLNTIELCISYSNKMKMYETSALLNMARLNVLLSNNNISYNEFDFFMEQLRKNSEAA